MRGLISSGYPRPKPVGNKQTPHTLTLTLTLPPTHVGESLKKAVQDGRVNLEDLHKHKRPRGLTRGQIRLVACQPPDDIDIRTAFVLAISAVYCEELKCVQGTLACSAVMGYLGSYKVLNRIMGNVKVKFEKLQNKKHLLKAAEPIHDFIHSGNDEDVKRKVLLYRNMAGPMHTTEEKEMAHHIVELLVRVAAGVPPNDNNSYGFYPYGKSAAGSTQAFKACPSPWFANALTFLYPYLTKPVTQWKELSKKYSHPLNANGLWPINILRRYIRLFTTFRSSRCNLFKAYELSNGTYHGKDGENQRTAVSRKEVSQMTEEDIEEMSDEPEDSVDGVFES